MVHVLYRPNLLDRSKDSLSYEGACRTLRDALLARFGTVDFTEPTYVEVNGIPWLRSQWDDVLPAGAAITVNVVPAEVTTAVLVSVTIASLLLASYAAYKTSQLPSIADAVGAGVPEKAPVFTFEGQRNIQRLNNVVDVVYGRLRWWPSYLCAPYVDYTNNKPTLHMWLCLGKGDYEIEDVRVNDTSFAAIGKARYKQHDSGYTHQATDDFDLVYYAKDFSGTELTGTNEEEHAVLGPYLLNPANTSVDSIKVNFAYSTGLYAVNADGAVQPATCTITITLTEIDSSGASTGQYQTFNITHTKATTTAYRVTETLLPGPLFTTGRYSISAVRTNAKNTSTNGQDQCTIESAFALGHSSRKFDASLLYVNLPGTDVVGQDAAEKVNVVATRKLRTRTNGAWTSTVTTRNPVWAILDILQQNFGAGLPDTALDLSYWEEIAAELSAHSFDYRFEQKTTVWDAISVVAAVFRGKPYWIGSDVRISVDTAVRTPVCVFTPDSAKDLRLHMAFQTSTENDCIEAAYVDPDTGLQDSVYFTPPGSEAVNPTKITFAGVTDRETAWRLAAYTYLQKTLLRDTVTFSTGLDGKIPMLGEVILVSWPLPAWTSAGIVLASDGGARLELSESVPYQDGWITLRANNGDKWGPIRYILEEALSASGKPIVALEHTPDASLDFTAIERDSIAYTIGQADTVTRRFQVTSATPSGDSVQIEGTEFNPSVFSYDNLSVPARGDDMLPYPSVTGKTPWLRVLEESGQYLRVEAGPIYGNPTSVTCSYVYILESVLTDDVIAAPWSHIGAGLSYPPTEADNYGASYYIPRQAGTVAEGALTDPYVLFIRLDVVVTGATYTTWWRARPGRFQDNELSVSHVYLVNNVDVAYISPGNPGNEASPASQGTRKGAFISAASLDANDAKLVVATDCPPGGSAEVRIESGTLVEGVFTVEHSIAKRINDVGPVTFSAADMLAAGIQGTETTYPALRVVADHVVNGELGSNPVSIPLQVFPLVSDPITHDVSYEYTGESAYVEGTSAYAGNGTFYDYATHVVRTYLLHVTGAFAGAQRLRIDTSCQSFFISEEVKDTIYVRNAQPATLKLISCAHLDPVVFSDTVGDITGTLRLMESTASQYAVGNWSCVLLDGNYEPVFTDMEWYTQRSGDMRYAPLDTPSSFTLMLFMPPSSPRLPTTEEWANIRATARYIVFMNTGVTMPNPSATFHGWGSVRAAMIDMFGRASGFSEWKAPDVP